MNRFLLLLVFFTSVTHAQDSDQHSVNNPINAYDKSYSFDYRLEYEHTNGVNDSIHIVNYYVNSQTNDFYAAVRKATNGYLFDFLDLEGVVGKAIVDGDHKNPGTIVLQDSVTVPFSNINAYHAAKYKIVTLSDTTIAGKSYSKVAFKMKNQKKAFAQNIGYHVYVIDTGKKMKPLLTHPLCINIWRRDKNMPDGLIVEKQVYTTEGALIFTEKLKEIAPVNLNLQLR